LAGKSAGLNLRRGRRRETSQTKALTDLPAAFAARVIKSKTSAERRRLSVFVLRKAALPASYLLIAYII